MFAMAWFTRQKPSVDAAPAAEERHVRTEGLWLKCDGCRQIIWRKALEESGQVCPKCEFHFKIVARARLRLLFDGPWGEFDIMNQDHDLGRRCLDAVLSQPGWTVRILTKNAAVVRDFDLIERYRNRVLVGLSLTATEERSHVIAVLEPNASPIRVNEAMIQ